MEFGEKLLMYRANNSLTQSQLADALKVDRRTIIEWELGRMKPRRVREMQVLSIIE